MSVFILGIPCVEVREQQIAVSSFHLDAQTQVIWLVNIIFICRDTL